MSSVLHPFSSHSMFPVPPVLGRVCSPPLRCLEGGCNTHWASPCGCCVMLEQRLYPSVAQFLHFEMGLILLLPQRVAVGWMNLE